MAVHERTSPRVAKIAAKILDGKRYTLAELKSVCASALAQTGIRKRAKKRKAVKKGRSLL